MPTEEQRQEFREMLENLYNWLEQDGKDDLNTLLTEIVTSTGRERDEYKPPFVALLDGFEGYATAQLIDYIFDNRDNTGMWTEGPGSNKIPVMTWSFTTQMIETERLAIFS
jgi:hypothetical protein